MVTIRSRWLVAAVAVAMVALIGLSGCTDAMVASQNISRAADQFEIFRRIVFYNGITGEYILVIEGYSSIAVDTDGDLAITVKTDDGRFLKHYLGLSDNVTYFSEQLESVKVSDARYRVIFKPSVLVPAVELH